jgi:uncharacterized protein YqgQ
LIGERKEVELMQSEMMKMVIHQLSQKTLYLNSTRNPGKQLNSGRKNLSHLARLRDLA